MPTITGHLYLTLGLLVLGESTGFAAETLKFVATIEAEATVYENSLSANGGGYSEVCVGEHASVDSTRHAYLRYDLPLVPDGARLLGVKLVLEQDRVRSIGPGTPKSAILQLERVTESWVEGSGRGLGNGPCGSGAAVAGIDWTGAPAVDGTNSAIAILPSSSPLTVFIDTDDGTGNDQLIADVLAWYTDPGSNHGWRLLVEDVVDNARVLVPGNLILTWSDPEVVFGDGFE